MKTYCAALLAVLFAVIHAGIGQCEDVQTNASPSAGYICVACGHLSENDVIVLPVSNMCIVTKDYDAYIEYATAISRDGHQTQTDRTGIGTFVKIHTQKHKSGEWSVTGSFSHHQLSRWREMNVNGYGIRLPEFRERFYEGILSLQEGEWRTLQSPDPTQDSTSLLKIRITPHRPKDSLIACHTIRTNVRYPDEVIETNLTERRTMPYPIPAEILTELTNDIVTVTNVMEFDVIKPR